MPKTRAQHERSLEDPAVCELLKIRDFLDNVMVRTDGCYVAGFRVAGGACLCVSGLMRLMEHFIAAGTAGVA